MARLATPTVQRRSYSAALTAARNITAPRVAPAVSTSFQQTRGVKTIDFAGTKEKVFGKAFYHELNRAMAQNLTFRQSVTTGLVRSFL
jgi:hypothetical protein